MRCSLWAGVSPAWPAKWLAVIEAFIAAVDQTGDVFGCRESVDSRHWHNIDMQPPTFGGL